MTEPNQTLLSDQAIPTVTLAGKAWPMPMLAPKQNCIVVPTVLRIVPAILASGDGKGMFDLKAFAKAIDEQTYRDLVTIAYTAVTRAHPEMTRAEFDEMPIGTMELILSVLVIAQQTGVIRPKMPGEPPSGEAPAGDSQTGMP